MILLFTKIIADTAFYFAFVFFVIMYFRATPIFLLLYLPPVFYCVLNIITLRKSNITVDYTKVFNVFVRVYTPFVIIALFIPALRSYMQVYSMPFAIIFLLSAAAVMRLSLHEREVHTQKSFWLGNAYTLGGALLVGVVVSLPWVSAFLRRIARFLLLDGVYGAFVQVMHVFLRFIEWFFGLFPEISPLEEPEGTPPEGIGIGAAQTNPDPATWLVVLYVLILSSLIAGVVYIIFRFLYVAGEEAPLRTTRDGRLHSTFVENMKPRTRTRNALRRVYKQFIFLCHKHGCAPQPSDTSIQYTHFAAEKFHLTTEAEALRALYLPVRYGKRQGAKEDVILAKSLLKRIKAKIN
ncbi:MAG: hypothetical protein FWC16_08675 [Defluviitaleaceae bacterium]|nr:hypothetical protein [Defluviitaleaceae bacterium]MCL2274985.1 hypothetical protein [Defluviitaleaceae bacterium]